MDLPKINISPTNPIKSSVESIKELSKKFLLSVSSTTNERLKKEIVGNENVLFNNENLNYSFAIKKFLIIIFYSWVTKSCLDIILEAENQSIDLKA